MDNNRRGSWLQTYSGLQYWPLDPHPEDIRIEDMAHSLALQCRFAGHCKRHYSVAQHSYHVSYLVPPEYAREGHIHDGPETYLVDLPRPLKSHSLLGKEYKRIERLNTEVMCKRFNLSYPFHPSVKKADAIMLAIEKRDIMGEAPAEWGDMVKPLDWHLPVWTWEEAEQKFLQRAKELGME